MNVVRLEIRWRWLARVDVVFALVALALVALGFVALVGAASAAEASAAAGEPPAESYDRPGWYGGIGAIAALSDYSLTTNDLGVVPPEPARTNPDFGHTGGVDARFGYRLRPRFAVEFDYQWQAGFDSRNSAISPKLEIDTHLLSLNAKLFGLTDRWQPYGLLGASLLIVNTEIVNKAFKKPFDLDVGFAPRFAAGVDFYLTPSWLLNVEGTYTVPVGSVDGANMGSAGAGVQYRF